KANSSEHGANRPGASACTQGLAAGYIVIPATIADYLAGQLNKKVSPDRGEFKQAKNDVTGRVDKLLSAKGTRSVDSFHRELGHIMWEFCGMARSADGLRKLRGAIAYLRELYWGDVR